MKYFGFLLLAFVISCTNNRSETNVGDTAFVSPEQSTSWIDDLKKFANALEKQDKPTVKSFFNFPINAGGGELWYLAMGDKSLEKGDSLADLKFTAEDFDTYYDSLFPTPFISCLRKLNIEELRSKGETQTGVIRIGVKDYKLTASVDQESNTVELNLYSEYDANIGDGETFRVEQSTIYVFNIVKDSIRFKTVWMAG